MVVGVVQARSSGLRPHSVPFPPCCPHDSTRRRNIDISGMSIEEEYAIQDEGVVI